MVATGFPYPVLAEVSVGIGDRLAIGVVGGATTVSAGFGVRPRLSIADFGSGRVVVHALALFYPETPSEAPWLLARPTVVYEHRVGKRLMLNAGVGAVLAAAVDRLGGSAGAPVYGQKRLENLWGVWNTVQLGGGFAFSHKTSAFFDVALVMRGLKLAGDEFMAAIPLIAAVGVSTEL